MKNTDMEVVHGDFFPPLLMTRFINHIPLLETNDMK